MFLTALMKDDHVKKQTMNRNRHVILIAHSILSVVRPRSFVSPVFLRLSATLHRKFGKKNIIEIFHSYGFGAFVQYVHENADFDTNTIDGKNTFHNLGRIEIITPHPQ